MSFPSVCGVAIVRRWLIVGVVLMPIACSGRRLPVPAIPAEKAAQEALAQYDANKDGFLDKEELKKCPALASCVKALDKDKDGRLSRGEIAERIKSYEANRVGLTALTVKVTLDRKPLAGATVTLTPEKFLGDALKPATGTTNTGGIVNVATAGTEVPGVASGMFRVEVSKKDGTGRETLPNRYNQATILGVEVGPDSQGVLRLALRGS